MSNLEQKRLDFPLLVLYSVYTGKKERTGRMDEKFTVDDFLSSLENFEKVLEMLEESYLNEGFEDMGDALELIEGYKKAVSAFKGVEEWRSVK